MQYPFNHLCEVSNAGLIHLMESHRDTLEQDPWVKKRLLFELHQATYLVPLMAKNKKIACSGEELSTSPEQALPSQYTVLTTVDEEGDDYLTALADPAEITRLMNKQSVSMMCLSATELWTFVLKTATDHQGVSINVGRDIPHLLLTKEFLLEAFMQPTRH